MIFEEVEEILRTFRLAKVRPRASIGHGGQTTRIGGSHTQALSWIGAGWMTSEVDVESETITFTPKNSGPVDRSLFDLNVVLPVHHTKLLTNDWTFSREEIYEDRI